MIDTSKRQLMKSGLLVAVLPTVGLLPACSHLQRRVELLPADANDLSLPPGFTSRVVARSGKLVANSDYLWPAAPDGGDCLPDPASADGWIYVCNSELDDEAGGASAIRFDAAGEVVDAYSILQHTTRNCAGGLSPWQSWLSCEETDTGQVWECDPNGVKAAQVLPALGSFNHEAVAFDSVRRRLYLTEDSPDGGLYRFTPDNWPDLSSGQLEIATQREASSQGMTLDWQAVPDPGAESEYTRYQVADVAVFDGGEGIVYFDDKVYFTTKGDNSVWQLDLGNNQVVRVYDEDDYFSPVLTGVDNITVDAAGRLFVAEDGGDMQVVMLTVRGDVAPIVQIVGHDMSEITGVAFSPDGTRLYFNSQRGDSGLSEDGITYEVSGPFATL